MRDSGLAKAAQVCVMNKTVLTIIVSSVAPFGIAATENSGAQEWEQEKLSFFTGNDVYSWCQSDGSCCPYRKIRALSQPRAR
jgi:hypothetical protein